MLERLFKWENLESLVLSNNIIKGTLPKMAYGVPKYTKEEVEANDTLKTAASVLVGKPKVFTYRLELPAWRPSRLALTPPLPNVLVT